MAADTMLATDDSAWEGAPGQDDLEQRVQRLEDAVAALCDTRIVEDRVAERVLEEMERRQAKAPPAPTVKDAPTPAAAAPVAEFSQPLEEQGDLHLKAARAMLAVATESPDALSLLGEIWWEARIVWRMVRDPYYKMTWLCKIVPIFALAYVTVWSWLSGYVFSIPTIPVIGFLDDLAILYVAFKVVTRETRRYGEYVKRRFGT